MMYTLTHEPTVLFVVDPCQLKVMTAFDLFQILGAVSVIFYTLFIRSQYLRIESVRFLQYYYSYMYVPSKFGCTVKPPIMDTPIRGQPPYNGQTACPLPLTVHTVLPPTKGQPLNNGQNARPHRVHYSEVPLYMCL